MSRTSTMTSLGQIRKHVFMIAIVEVIASVMVFGMVECWTNIVVLKNAIYQPVYMIGMVGPMGFAMSVISIANVRAAWRRVAHTYERDSPRRRRKPRNWLVIETLSVAAASTAAFISIQVYAHLVVGAPGYSPTGLLVMAGSVGLIMAPIAFFGIRELKLYILQNVSDFIRGPSFGKSLDTIQSTRGSDRSSILLRLKTRRVLESTVIVIVSVITFGLVDYAANTIFGDTVHYHPVDMIGMIAPMALIMGFVSYASLKNDSRYTFQLLSGIEKVAAGDFETTLDPESSGPFKEVFRNFNTMCAELRSVQTLRDDFINDFSHEFKSPITSIRGFAELILEERISEDERRQYLSIIVSESNRLSEMAGNALMMARLESQHYIGNRTPYSLDEQIRECIILLSPQWSKKRLEVTADLIPAAFVGNADLMKQVWINLLSNSIKFTPESGEIAVGLHRDGECLLISVADSGSGMTEEELEHVFEKYYQGDSSKSSKGLGLGLSIVRKIVRLCGGNVDAQSVPGRGSVFTVSLPMDLPLGEPGPDS